MGVIKKVSSKIHIGILEGFVIAVMVAAWYTAWYEGYMLTQFEFSAMKREFTSYDVLGNCTASFIGSLCGMVLPGFVQHARSKFSLSGKTIDPLETLIIVMFLGVMLYCPFIMLSGIEKLLLIQLENKDITQSLFDYRMSKTSNIVGLNLILDVFLGAFTIYEVQRSSSKPRKIEVFGEDTTERKADTKEEKK
jgi:hypothetical protein